MLQRSVLLSGTILILALAACAPAAAPTMAPAAMMEKTPDQMMKKTSEPMMEKTPDAMMKKTPEAMIEKTSDTMIKETPQAMMEKTPDALMEMPAWFSAPLTNASTGENFTIQDFKGKVVLVETMAMWCSTCLRQQKEVKALHDQLGQRDDFVSVGIDIDLNENLVDLKNYTAKNGFDWIYTVASPDAAREIGNLYGQQFLNPPSAPMLIIERHGAVRPLPFGVKSAADLQKALEPFLNEAM